MHGVVAVVTGGLVAATPRPRRPVVARSRSAARRRTGCVLASHRTSGSFHGHTTSECGDEGYRYAGCAVAQRSAGCPPRAPHASVVVGRRRAWLDGVLRVLRATGQTVSPVKPWVEDGLTAFCV